MNDVVLFDQPAPMWWLEPATVTGKPAEEIGDILRLGAQSIPLEGIMSYRIEQVIERGLEARWLVAGLGVLLGLVFLIGVLGFGWLECLLAGFVVISGAVIAGLAEIFGVTGRRRFRVSVFSKDGRPVTYTSADNRDIARLVSFLDKALGR